AAAPGRCRSRYSGDHSHGRPGQVPIAAVAAPTGSDPGEGGDAAGAGVAAVGEEAAVGEGAQAAAVDIVRGQAGGLQATARQGVQIDVPVAGARGRERRVSTGISTDEGIANFGADLIGV